MTKSTATASMDQVVFNRLHRAARIESGRTGEPLPKVYARWLIAGAGLGQRGGIAQPNNAVRVK